MKHFNITILFLISLVILSIPLYSTAMDDRKGKQEVQDVENEIKKSMSNSKSQEMKQRGRITDDKPILEKQLSSNLVYKPPLRGAPIGRVGGGSRGTGETGSNLLALVPDHVGLTIKEGPSLFWYLSKQTPYPIELTVIEYQAIQPLIENHIKPSVHPGVNRIELADYGVHLSPGVSYQWFVSIVSDPDHRSKDIIAGGAIERMDISEALRNKLSHANRTEVPHIYAEAGLWYDSLSAISDLIDSSPNDQELKTLRASLLKQVGLGKVAWH
jgi:hypothetical protein